MLLWRSSNVVRAGCGLEGTMDAAILIQHPNKLVYQFSDPCSYGLTVTHQRLSLVRTSCLPSRHFTQLWLKHDFWLIKELNVP